MKVLITSILAAIAAVGSFSQHNWQGDVTTEFDTSGRGEIRTFEGRGLVETESPLKENTNDPPTIADADETLKTIFVYDSLGRQTERKFANQPAREKLGTVYDDFGRVWKSQRVPGTGGGNTVTTTYTYDDASNVTRSVTDEAAVGTLADALAKYDEGGFNYQSRTRTVVDASTSDRADDLVTELKFDWAGNVTEQKSLGDATVADRVITTHYDGANRPDYVTDSLGGQTNFTLRDKRGNLLIQTVKLNATETAATTTEYDALGRAWHITGPLDSAEARADAVRAYDSRGNLLRETLRDGGDTAKMTTVFGYDNAGRQTRQAVLATAIPADTPFDLTTADCALHRVTDFGYYPDGQLWYRTTYNNNSAAPLYTETGYDALGRVYWTLDPSGSYFIDDYAAAGFPIDGRLHQRTIYDGVGERLFSFDYDGHDRMTAQTAYGTVPYPNLTTGFTYDGLNRQKSVTDPRGIVTATVYDLAGRQTLLTEDSGGALERQTGFVYNRLSQLTSQTAQNKSSTGSPLAAQATHFRYDSLGRLLRTIYPDSAANPDSPTCTDCVTLAYDFGGRTTSRTDQGGLVTTTAYDRRSLLLTRTTDVAGTPDPKDTFAYDALGRLTSADRGNTVSATATSHATYAYNDLGDRTAETLQIAGGTARTTAYAHDQAGNRKSLTYPGGSTVGYTPTALNQVAEMTLKPTPSDPARPLVKYDHVNQGHVLENRRVTTDAVGGNSYYDYTPGYDTHRRLMSIANRFTPGGGSPTDVATYALTRDNSGNPLTQTTGGLPAFADDRNMTPDRLNRVISTAYTTYGGTETSVLDRVGNRETHAPREGSPTAYTLANAANEYATIDPDGPGGSPPAGITYDAAGNLETDEDGRWYAYDEHDRLTNVWDASGFPLAEYYYDALGRRVQAIFYDPNTSLSRTARYYYDGSSVIEERDGSQPGEPRTRYHVNGAQYIDEHIATYTDGPLGRESLLVPPADGIPSGAPRSRAGFTYYLQNDLYTVTGVGEADGTIAAAFTYDAAGRPTIVGGGSTECQPSDADCSGAVNLADVSAFVSVLLGGTPCSPCAGDAGGSAPGSPPDGLVDGRDVQAFVHCLLTGDCPTTGGPSCTPGDLSGPGGTPDGAVTLADVAPFVSVLLTGPANADELCRVDMGGPNSGPPDGVADGHDIQALVHCLVLGDCPPGGSGGPATTDNTFYLHGAIVDQLDPDPTTGLPRLLLQYNRARYYDLRHARWLQRDPLGYVDGSNLYQAFRGNASVNVDPSGEVDPISAAALAALIFFLWPPDPAVAPTGAPGEREYIAQLNHQIAVERSIFLVTVVLYPVGGVLGQGLAPTVGGWATRAVGSELAGTVTAYGTECLITGAVVTAGQEATYTGWTAQTQGWGSVPGLYDDWGDVGRIGLGMTINTSVPAVFNLPAFSASRPSVSLVEVNGQPCWAVATGSRMPLSRAAQLSGSSADELLGLAGAETRNVPTAWMLAPAEGTTWPAGAKPAPRQLVLGQAWERERLLELGLPKNTEVWRPTLAQTESAAFRVIVGPPKFTRSGLPIGTTVDVSRLGGQLEIKGGLSMLDSSYQLRLQTYRSLMEGYSLTIETTRPANPVFKAWLEKWGVIVKKPCP